MLGACTGHLKARSCLWCSHHQDQSLGWTLSDRTRLEDGGEFYVSSNPASWQRIVSLRSLRLSLNGNLLDETTSFHASWGISWYKEISDLHPPPSWERKSIPETKNENSNVNVMMWLTQWVPSHPHWLCSHHQRVWPLSYNCGSNTVMDSMSVMRVQSLGVLP